MPKKTPKVEKVVQYRATSSCGRIQAMGSTEKEALARLKEIQGK